MSCYFCDESRIESIHDFPHHGFPNTTIGAMTLMRHYDGESTIKVELNTDVTLDISVDGAFRGCEDVSVTATGFIEGVSYCPYCGRKLKEGE